MMRFHITNLLAIIFLGLSLSSVAVAASDSSIAIPAAPINRADTASLQRGAAIFVNYCLGCHSAQYVRYGRIAEDLSIPDEMAQKHLILSDREDLTNAMVSSMSPEDAKTWFGGAIPPDLSLSGRLRGADWLYAYLRGFYRDSSRPSGWNNHIFPSVAMPHVLADIQNNRSSEYNAVVLDLVNFMDYMADPSRPERHRMGYIMIAVLLVFMVATFFLYREYWRDVK